MNKNNLEQATFGAGCFWGVEENFRQIDGVEETAVGFMGGGVPNPSYERVCGGDTNHAEVVHLKYDPDKVSFDELLNVFWTNHDPTQVNRQGPDVGTQYRSVVFYHTPEQQTAAENSKPPQAATQIVPAEEFYRAEEYHQNYIAKQKG